MPIPTTDNGRIQWSINCEAEFPTVAADLGFSTDEMKDVLDDCRTMRFVIQNGQKSQAHSKAANSYKYDLLGNSQDGVGEPEMPVYTQVEPPATVAGRGILKRFSKWEERVKAHPSYSEATGDLLQINSAQSAAVSPDNAKPKGKGTAMPDSVGRLDWIKGKFDGVDVEGQRGDETAWTKLGRDFRSPFDDERQPLQANKPEERRYRLRYLIDDAPVGDWSDVIVIITKP
jgi:hypothetical protein